MAWFHKQAYTAAPPEPSCPPDVDKIIIHLASRKLSTQVHPRKSGASLPWKYSQIPLLHWEMACFHTDNSSLISPAPPGRSKYFLTSDLMRCGFLRKPLHKTRRLGHEKVQSCVGSGGNRTRQRVWQGREGKRDHLVPEDLQETAIPVSLWVSAYD